MAVKTVCIIGGTGFVGHHLVNRLAKEGYRLKILARHPERNRELQVLPGTAVVKADVHDPLALSQALNGCEAVINLVGILNEKGHKGRGFYRAHVELPRKILDACRNKGIKRLLHMSALGADAAHGLSHYQRSKGEGENLVHAGHHMQVTSFRPSIIFGPGDSFFNRFATLLRLAPPLLPFPLACAEARFAPVYVGDVVEAFAASLNNPATFGQRYELCGPQVYSLEELVHYTAQTLGLKRNILGLGKGLSRLQAALFEYLPGKPLSVDNVLTMQRDHLCEAGGPSVLERPARSIEQVVPYYLQRRGQLARYDEYRRLARRG